MLYASVSSDGALWETLLRNIVPEAAPPHEVVLAPTTGQRIARLRLTRDVPLLSLSPLSLRWLIANPDRRDRIGLLTRTPKYSATHSEAGRLLGDYPRAAGLCWMSRQTETDRVYVFYHPPMAVSDFVALESIALDSRRGWQLIDQALARAGMHRLDASALAAELLPQQLAADSDDDESRE